MPPAPVASGPAVVRQEITPAEVDRPSEEKTEIRRGLVFAGLSVHDLQAADDADGLFLRPGKEARVVPLKEAHHPVGQSI